jgi:hypothetical protein
MARVSRSERRPDPAKALAKKVAPGVLLALCAAVAIGFGLFYLFGPRNTQPKNSHNSQIVAVPTPSPVKKEANPAPANLDSGHSGAIVAEDSAHDQAPAPTPVPTAAPLSQPTAIASDTSSRDAKLSEAERKSVERERREAERKRSRLEAMYRKHEISSEAYKKGQDEYQSEMAKYRSVVNGAESKNE